MERVFDQQAETLASGLDHDKYLFQCGVVFALRMVASLPDQLTQALERSRDRTAESESTDPGTFLNTVWYERATGTKS